LIPLSRKPTKAGDLPPAYEATSGKVTAGHVFVRPNEGGDVPAGGKHVVLQAGGGSCQVITQASVDGGMENAGTYLSSADLDQLGTDRSKPTMRLYTKRDTLLSFLSWRGGLAIAPVLVGIVLALVGIWIAAFGENGPSAAVAAQRAETALEWVVYPADHLDANAKPSDVVKARRAVHRRAVQASRCFDNLEGQTTPVGVVPDVTCTQASPPWYRNKDKLAWFALIGGLITAIGSGFTLKGQFGFQKSPA
jgi:hypothetical protein